MLRRALATAGAFVVVSAFVGAAVPTSRAAGANPFPFVGTLTLYDAQGHPYDAASGAYVPRMLALDPGLGRVVVGMPFENRLFLVDPHKLEQTAGFPTGYPLGVGLGAPTVYDADGHRLFMGGSTSCPNPATCFSVGQVHVLDVGHQANGPTFTLPTRFGDLEMVTMQYASTHGHRVLYVVLLQQRSQAANTTILLALDADRLDRPDAALWSYDISSSCPGFAVSQGNQPYLGIARGGDFAYFACRGRTRPDGRQLTHHSAVVVHFGGSDPTQVDPARFRTEISAFAGDMAFGFIVGDPVNERLVVVLAGGSNNRIAVFDPVHAAWTGSAPVSGNTNMWGATVDPSGSGRAYVVLQARKMLMTDVTGLPLPQGQEYELGVAPESSGPPLYDPATRHLFVVGPRFSDGSNTHPALVRVYRDDVPHGAKPTAADPDAGTDDLDEVPGRTPVAYSAGASAYGARVDLVGGLRATPAGSAVNDLNNVSATFAVVAGLAAPLGVPVNGPPQLSGNDRSTTMGWVGTTQVTPSAATAQAVGLAYDESTSADLANLGAEQAAQDQVPEAKQSYCSDTQERPLHESEPGSAADCDLAAQRAAADATGERQSAAAAPRIASGRSHTSVVRSRNGAVAFAEAIARDITLPMPDGGQLRIDEARNVAETRAHGRTGTARSSVKPVLQGVTITDAAGRTAYACEDCDPQAVADAITARDPNHLGAVVPRGSTGALSATPKGAQALVLKDAYQYWNDFVVNNDTSKEVAVLELVYYDDGDEPSRLVVKLAGVLAESHFTVALPAGDVPETLGGLDGADTLATPGAGLGFVGADALAGSPRPAGAGSGRNRRRLYTVPAGALGGFLFHRPGEAVLFVLVWALLATPLWLAARRRSLLTATHSAPNT